MKKTVHIIIEGGCVIDAYANCDVDIVVYDLDTQDPDMRAEVELAVSEVKQQCNEVEIY